MHCYAWAVNLASDKFSTFVQLIKPYITSSFKVKTLLSISSII
jgi:hypothetical protein